MTLKDIKKCPVCNSDKLNKKNKKYIICENCNSKIGITKNELWYEYSLKNNNNIESNNN